MPIYRLEINETAGATYPINALAARDSLMNALLAADPDFTLVKAGIDGVDTPYLIINYKGYAFNFMFDISTFNYGAYVGLKTGGVSAAYQEDFSGVNLANGAANNTRITGVTCHFIVDVYTNATDILIGIRPYNALVTEYGTANLVGLISIHDMVLNTDHMYGLKVPLSLNDTNYRCMDPYTGKRIYFASAGGYSVDTSGMVIMEHAYINQTNTPYEHCFKYTNNIYFAYGNNIPANKLLQIGTENFIGLTSGGTYVNQVFKVS